MMKAAEFKLTGILAAAAVTALAGCSNTNTASSTVESGAPAPMTTEAMAAAASSIPGLSGLGPLVVRSASSIYSSLGGPSGVDALAQSFGRKLANSFAVTKHLDDATIEAAKGGLKSTLAILGGQPAPAGTTDLVSALSGKGLDANGVKAMSIALEEAGREMNLNTQQVSSLSSIIDAVGKMVVK